MNKKNLTIIISLFFVLLIISLLVVKKENSTWARGHFANKTPVIKDFPVNKIAKIALYDSKNRVELLQKDNKWIVFNKYTYPADFQKIRKFILKIKNINIAQKVIVKQDKYKELKLISPKEAKQPSDAGTVLEVYDNMGNKIAGIIFGKYHYAQEKETPTMQEAVKDGRFLKLITSSNPPVLVSDPFLDAAPLPSKWLDRTFVDLKKIKSAERLDEQGKALWKIYRKDEKSPFTIAGMHIGDMPKPQKMFEITTAFRKFDFNNILPADTKTEITGLDKPETFIYESCTGGKYKFEISMNNKKAYLKMTVLPTQKDKKSNLTNDTISDKFFEKYIYEIPRYYAKNLLIPRDELVSQEQMPTSIMGN
jgi:hypothetical protein